MKRISVLLFAAALMLSLAACGKNDKPASSEILTEASESTGADDTDYGFEIPEFDPMAGINITAEPLTEADVPDDWHEVSYGSLSLMVPPDVVENEETNMAYYFVNEEKTVRVMFMEEPQQWEKNKDYSDEEYPDMTDENLKKAFAELGVVYDGTRPSLNKALLSVTEADRTDSNAESFELIAALKAQCIGMFFPGVHYLESDGKDVFVYFYEGIKFDPSAPQEEHNSVWVEVFTDDETLYSLIITAASQEEVLKIASTIKVSDK